MELYKKENPLVISSNEYVASNETIINSKDFPVIINIIDKVGAPIENLDQVIKFQALHYNVSDKLIPSVTPHQIRYVDHKTTTRKIENMLKVQLVSFYIKIISHRHSV